MRNVILLGTAIVMMAGGVLASEDTTNLKAELQSSLQRSIDRMLIDGAIQQVDMETGELTQFYPVDVHAMILTMGENYVMCSDLKTPEGKSVTVDYYLASKGNRYVIIQTEINNRKPLKALMKAGLAKKLK